MRRHRKMKRVDEGFTLVELLVVMLMISILLTVAIATYAATTNSANAAACRQNQKVFNDAAMISQATAGADVPTALEDLRPYVENFDTIVKCPEDGTPLLFNASLGRVSCPNHP